MRLMQSDLAILNAEQYDLGLRLPSGRVRKGRNSPHSDDPVAPRKKAKVHATTAESPQENGDKTGEEEEKKRARGRPRLDTKDETAADRRRTQIRLAQRAYRNRKENAIQTLEKKVLELKETNEEMSNAFMKLHDFALSQGLLERVPEFGRQLRATTERFLTLARKSSEDSGSKDDDQAGTPEPDLVEQSIQSSDAPVPSRGGGETPSPEVSTRTSPEQVATDVATQALYGGFVVSHETQSLTSSKLAQSSFLPPFSAPPPASHATDYEIVTLPTFDNASFPFSVDANTATTSFGDIFGQDPPHLSPYSSLALPDTHSYGETTFGRRLQRVALERGLQLIDMPTPPRETFARVFGFCILFEPVDKIKARLRAGIDKAKTESMHYWQHPFLGLGGAGSHFPGFSSNTTPPSRPGRGPFETAVEDGGSVRIGNQGTTEALKHANALSGFGVGPYDPDVMDARAKKLDPMLRINMPEFQGDFYDADEVELYLQQRGIAIQAGQDFVTAEVDIAAFDDEVSSGDVSPFNNHLESSALHPLNPSSRYNGDGIGGSLGSSGALGNGSPGRSAGGTASLTVTDAESSAWPMGGIIPSSTSTDDSLASIFATSGPTRFGDASILGFPSAATPHCPSKTIITLDVNVFIRELTERGICLGKSPGFRPRDVNTSFWIATRNG
ncbi:AP-1-like transcription factor [Pleurostoma richardsiae]|uniref:AP-1-like transcription factor n=1 Tax=Pleurostoma richardsiae TaxID=41990 RepID=A0AA38RBP4_9PEZI|nr:AP-1-like transcription factor [Pleurostoma richardsiae]